MAMASEVTSRVDVRRDNRFVCPIASEEIAKEDIFVTSIGLSMIAIFWIQGGS